MQENKCFLYNHCNHVDCNNDFCMRKYKLDSLFDMAMVSRPQRQRISLTIDADGTDLNEFQKLKLITEDPVNFVKNGKNLFIHSKNCGNGKAQPDESLILCENGFVTMKDIQVGQRLFGDDGNLHTVIGKFDRGVKPVYRVTFQDNTTTLCCNEHLWTVFDHKDKQNRTLELQEIINNGLNFGYSKKRNQAWRYDIPVTTALTFSSRQNFMDPYLLGYILGDGHISRKSAINIAVSDTDAAEIIPELTKLLPEGYSISKTTGKYSYNIKLASHNGIKNTFGSFKNKLKSELYNLGLLDLTCYTKFIPDNYKFTSLEDRLSIVQGLMDTDGTVSPSAKGGCQISYATVSSQLAKDFAFIIESIGGTCSIRERHGKSYTYKGEKKYGHTWYNCTIKLPEGINPFRLSRKHDIYAELSIHTQRNPYRSLRKIEFVDNMHCYCIMTDNPSHLYLTDDLIVTHNTSWAIRFIQEYLDNIWPESDLTCRALFVSVPRYLIELKANISVKSEYIAYINEHLMDADIVIWDDIASKTGTDFEISQLFAKIDARICAGKSNIYTSNLNKDEMAAALGERLASRVCSYSVDIELNGADKRSLAGGNN